MQEIQRMLNISVGRIKAFYVHKMAVSLNCLLVSDPNAIWHNAKVIFNILVLVLWYFNYFFTVWTVFLLLNVDMDR